MKEKKFNEFIDYDKRFGKMLISGIEGRGKTMLLTAIAVGKMLHGREDCIKSYNVVDEYNRLGFSFSKNYEHLLFSNFPINCSGTAIPTRRNYIVRPFRLGYHDHSFYTDFFPPYALFCIMEGKIYYDAYKWDKIPIRSIGWLKTMRQANYDMAIDSQYFKDITIHLRRLCNRFILLTDEVKNILDSEGRIIGHKLYCIEWHDLESVELYEATSKKENCEEYVLILDKCYHENYDTRFCRYLHLLGRENEDFTIEQYPDIRSIADIYAIAEDLSYEEPDGYYPSKKKSNPEMVEDVSQDDYLEV